MRPGLRDWAARAPRRPALLIDGEEIIHYATLEARANRLAHALKGFGLRRGDHAAMLAGNTADAIALCWAAWRSGVYLTPLPTTLTPPEVAYIVKDCGAKFVSVHHDFAAVASKLPALCPGATFRALGEETPNIAAWEPELATLPETPRNGETPGGLMMYSSGTTGAPKGILRPLPAADETDIMPTFAGDLISLFDLTPDIRYLQTAPLYHAASLRFALAVTAIGGFVVVMRKFDATRALHLIDAHDLTLTQWAPTMFRRMLDLPDETRTRYKGASHVRAIHGAAPCAPALKRAMIDWWGPILQEYYSGSEGVGLTRIDSDEWLERPGSVGRAYKGELHILGPDDEELPPGETGRVFFSGMPPFSYHNAPEKTATRTSKQGWQSFGDVGHMDEEGYLWLTDRGDDMIISGGVNVYPQEIEAVIEQADFIAECGVVGAPDPQFEERPVAFVVARPGEVDVATRLQPLIEARLGKIKRPREIRVIDALPMSATGKLLRRALRDLL